MQRVVKIVAPLSMDTIATDFPWPYNPRVVEITLGNQRQVTTGLGLKLRNLTSQLFEKMHRRGIKDGVHGVDAQPVEVIVPEPHQRVVAEKSADFVAASPVKIYGFAPWGRVPLGEIGTKAGEIVSRGSQVVVYNVEN